MPETYAEELRFGRQSYGTATETDTGVKRKLIWLNDASPNFLFGAADRGGFWDFMSSKPLAQNSNGQTPVNQPGDPIGYCYSTDGSLQSTAAIQATASRRPVWLGMPRTLGNELCVNGRFTADATWAKGTGWTITAPKATKTAGVASSLSQPVTLIPGQEYIITFQCNVTAGSVQVQFTGGTTVSGVNRTLTGTWTDRIRTVTGNTTLEFFGDATFAGSVKSISVKPITHYTMMGALFDGIDDKLQTANINMSASTKMTIVASVYFDDPPLTTQGIVEVGNAFSAVPGSAAVEFITSPRGYLQGATGAAINDFAGGPFLEPRLMVVSFDFDTTGGTIPLQVKNYLTGNSQVGTPSGVSAGGGNLVNGAITVGAAANDFIFWSGLIHRMMVINRNLSTAERLAAETWARQGIVYGSVIGDSTVAYNDPAFGVNYTQSVSALIGGFAPGLADISFVGDKIVDQKTKWIAIPDKSSLQAVFVQVGLNDINTYSGVSKTAAQILADLQDLINTVNSSKPAGCRVYASTLTPARGWLGLASGQPAAAYADWLTVNQAIMGLGPNPILGVDARISGHTAALNDGNGNLNPIYAARDPDDFVHPSNEGKFIIGQYWRTQLEADNLVQM